MPNYHGSMVDEPTEVFDDIYLTQLVHEAERGHIERSAVEGPAAILREGLSSGRPWEATASMAESVDELNALYVKRRTELLATHQAGYDLTFHVASRLPGEPPLQLGGARTVGGLAAWTLLAVAGIVALALTRRRVPAVVSALLLASSFVDLYMAYVGDSVEVQRHMVGPLARMTAIMVVCIVSGLDAALSARKRS